MLRLSQHQSLQAPAPVRPRHSKAILTTWALHTAAQRAARPRQAQRVAIGLGIISLPPRSTLKEVNRFISLNVSLAAVHRAGKLRLRSKRGKRHNRRHRRSHRNHKHNNELKACLVNTDQTLRNLDKHASEFNFPIFDNAYVEFAAARLTAFRKSDHWLAAFEVLGYSTQEGEFVDDLYAYGSCVEKAGFIASSTVFSSARENPLFDPKTNDCVADWKSWGVTLHGEALLFSPTREDYREAGIEVSPESGPGSLKEIQLLRFAISKLGTDRMFLADQEILNHFPRCQAMPKFIQTTNWQHPDLSGKEKPSESGSIRSLLDAIATGSPNLFQPGRSNSNWQFWQAQSKSA